LIAKHGIWVGKARTTYYPGTNPPFSAENIDIKKLMKKEAFRVGYKNWRVPFPEVDRYRRGLITDIKDIVPDNTRWLLNTSWTLTFHTFWIAAFPEAEWVLPRRSVIAVTQSMDRHPSMRRRNRSVRKQFIIEHHKRQEQVMRMCPDNHIMVKAKKIANKDTAEIERLFSFLDIPVNWEIVNEWIQPKLMGRG